MKPILFTLTAFCGLIFLHACAADIPAEKTLAGYKYPIEQTLDGKYPLDKHYSLSIYDEGEGGVRRITITPSEQNEIGDRDAVSDENLFVLENKTLLYAAFYDDWTIRQSVEAVFDEDGALAKTVTVTYDPAGKPLSLEEQTPF